MGQLYIDNTRGAKGDPYRETAQTKGWVYYKLYRKFENITKDKRRFTNTF